MKTEGQGNHMKVMAIDYGDARTGVAISDALGWMSGQTTVIHSWKPEKTAEEVARLLRESGARGGGKPDMAQGSAPDGAALESAKRILFNK